MQDKKAGNHPTQCEAGKKIINTAQYESDNNSVQSKARKIHQFSTMQTRNTHNNPAHCEVGKQTFTSARWETDKRKINPAQCLKEQQYRLNAGVGIPVRQTLFLQCNLQQFGVEQKIGGSVESPSNCIFTED